MSSQNLKNIEELMNSDELITINIIILLIDTCFIYDMFFFAITIKFESDTYTKFHIRK